MSVETPRASHAVTSHLLTIGAGERAMLPIDAFSSSTEGAIAGLSFGKGLILILNIFLRCSSSPSDSSEEKKCALGLGAGGNQKVKEVAEFLNRQLLFWRTLP